MNEVFVAGVGMTRFAKQPEATLKTLAGAAVTQALADAGVTVDRVEAVYAANATAGVLTGQEMIRGQVALRPLGLDRVPFVNVENACASSSTAVHLAWQAVAAGAYDIVLAFGAEKLTHPDKRETFRAIARALDVETELAGADADHSSFMDVYAQMTRDYMERSGATERDFAEVAAKNQRNGALNPLAQYGNANITADDVLGSREIVWPLTLLMCSPISDGAAATVIVSERAAAQLGLVGPRIRVRASVLTSGTAPAHIADGVANGVTRAAERAYEQAAVGPDEVDVVELHDGTAPAELIIMEELGVARPGGAPAMVASGDTQIGGRIPINPSGGLLARGHPIGATGIAQLCELTWQLRGQAGPRQAGAGRGRPPRVALAENSGGWLQDDVAVAAVTILTREDAVA